MSLHTVLVGLVTSSTNHLSCCRPVVGWLGRAAASSEKCCEHDDAENPTEHGLEIANECRIVVG